MSPRSLPAAPPRARAVILLTVALSACGGAQIPPDARTTVVSLDHLDCAECGDKLAVGMRGRAGVYAATFDKRRSELTVTAGASFDAFAEAKALSKGEDYALVLGAGHGGYIAWPKPPEGADVFVVVAEGKDVPDLAPHLAKGKVTVVDFSAKWCQPCRKVDEHMLAMLPARPDVAYRKLDIGDWDTPLAHHYLQGVPKLPYVLVYDKAGRRIDAIAGLDLTRLDAAIAQGAR